MGLINTRKNFSSTRSYLDQYMRAFNRLDNWVKDYKSFNICCNVE